MECAFRKNENHLFFAAFALGVNKILLSWLRHYKKGQEMLRQTLMTTNKNIVHSSGVIILSYKNEFRGKLFFLWVDHEKAHRTTLRTFTQQPPVHPYIHMHYIESTKSWVLKTWPITIDLFLKFSDKGCVKQRNI